MREIDYRYWLMLLAGSLMFGIAAVLIGTYSLKGSSIMVFFGFLLAVAGYKLTWLAVHKVYTLRGMLEITYEKFIEGDSRYQLWHNFLIFAGVFMMAYGTMIFSQVISGQDSSGAIAGALIFLGYITAHEGINGVLI